MLASVKNGWVLLMNPKTGSTSLKKALRPMSDVMVGGSAELKHLNYLEFRDMFGDFFFRNNCEVCVVLRHPAEVLKSWYRFRSRRDLSDTSHPKHENYMHGISFAQFLDEWSNGKTERANVGVGVEFCYDTSSAPAKDLSYYRFEDIGALCDRIARKSGKSTRLRHVNRSTRKRGFDELNDFALSDFESIPKFKHLLAQYEDIEFQGPGNSEETSTTHTDSAFNHAASSGLPLMTRLQGHKAL